MLETLLEQISETHRARFNTRPQWLASAPGRVNLIGDHTDYTDGFALPFAINRYTVVSASLSQHDGVELFSTFGDNSATIALGPSADSGVGSGRQTEWHDYIRGVLSLMADKGFPASGLSICVHGDLPIGSGLSSSASLELAVATLLEGVAGRSLGDREKILLCQRAEHDYAHVPCGILDQFAICEAQSNAALLLDCRAQSAQLVPVLADEVGFVIIDSKVRHKNSDGGYATRRKQCEEAQQLLGCSLRDATLENVAGLTDPLVERRAHHVVSENARVGEFAQALSQCDVAHAGELMFASHNSLRDDFEVSCTEVDALVEISRTTDGVLGARMTGGGFGGSVIVMARPADMDAVASAIAAQYHEASGYNTEPLLVSAVSGCRLHATHD